MLGTYFQLKKCVFYVLHFYAGPYNMNITMSVFLSFFGKNSSPKTLHFVIVFFSLFFFPTAILKRNKFVVSLFFRCFSLSRTIFVGNFLKCFQSPSHSQATSTIQYAHHICEHSTEIHSDLLIAFQCCWLVFDTNVMIIRQVNVTTHLQLNRECSKCVLIVIVGVWPKCSFVCSDETKRLLAKRYRLFFVLWLEFLSSAFNDCVYVTVCLRLCDRGEKIVSNIQTKHQRGRALDRKRSHAFYHINGTKSSL